MKGVGLNLYKELSDAVKTNLSAPVAPNRPKLKRFRPSCFDAHFLPGHTSTNQKANVGLPTASALFKTNIQSLNCVLNYKAGVPV